MCDSRVCWRACLDSRGGGVSGLKQYVRALATRMPPQCSDGVLTFLDADMLCVTLVRAGVLASTRVVVASLGSRRVYVLSRLECQPNARMGCLLLTTFGSLLPGRWRLYPGRLSHFHLVFNLSKYGCERSLCEPKDVTTPMPGWRAHLSGC